MRNKSLICTLPDEIKNSNENSESLLTQSRKRKINIKLEAYQNVETVLPICDIQTLCYYNFSKVGETGLIAITDNELLPINHTFIVDVNTAVPKEMNRLISLPAVLKIYLNQNVFDPDLYEQLTIRSEPVSTKLNTFDSVVSLYEALTQDELNGSLTDSKNKLRKGKKISEKTGTDQARKEITYSLKKKRQESLSAGSKLNEHDLEVHEKRIYAEVTSKKILYGEATLDFIPFFHGDRIFKETLLIKKCTEYKDDRMNTFKTHPKIIVTVSIDEPLDTKHCLIMNFSIESIFNLPIFMNANMDCEVCWVLPNLEDPLNSPIIVDKPVYTTNRVKRQYKLWPDLKQDGDYRTKYIVNDKTDDIKCKFDENISTYFQEGQFRLEFNVIKRNFFPHEDRKTIAEFMKTYKNIILEIFAYPIPNRKFSPVTDQNIPQLTQMLDMRTGLHLMAIVDISGLLYPGARKTRVAALVKPFCLSDAVQICGRQESYFKPLLTGEGKTDEMSKYNFAKKEFQDKEKKSVKGSRTNRKSFRTESLTLESTIKKKLPNESDKTESEPSMQLFNDDGKPCFIVVEIELSQSIVEPHDIEDLSNKLKQLLQKTTDKTELVVITNKLAKEYYVELLNEIVVDMNEKFLRFLRDNPKIEGKSNSILIEFIKFLQQVGSYKLYLNSITRAISSLTATDNNFNASEFNSDTFCRSFMGQIYCYLTRKMHEMLNTLVCNNFEPVVKLTENYNQLFFYAKEASELGEIDIADRYFLERLSTNENDPDCWFDYAIFLTEQKQTDRALECVRTALSRNIYHRYTLVLYGLILDSKQQKEDAETCLLNLMVHQSKWTEGWGILYLFYQKLKNYVCMDWALEMAEQNLCSNVTTDYFTEFQDFAWSNKHYPNTVFFRTAVLLIKMRLLDWAEIACAQETNSNFGYVNDLLAVICYYKKLYFHAIEHLERSESTSSNYFINALKGHCLLWSGKIQEAKHEYYLVLQSQNSSEDLHLVYVNCAKIMENLGEPQEARKLILLACKHYSTPYTWLTAGRLYCEQKDFLSAEECFSVANSLDTRHAEVWGYLTLVNLKLTKLNEAELCYQQAVHNNLNTLKLFNEILDEKDKYNQNYGNN